MHVIYMHMYYNKDFREFYLNKDSSMYKCRSKREPASIYNVLEAGRFFLIVVLVCVCVGGGFLY